MGDELGEHAGDTEDGPTRQDDEAFLVQNGAITHEDPVPAAGSI